MQKSEFFTQSFLYVISGLVSNSQNVQAKPADMVETAFNAAKIAADRYEQIMGAMDPAVLQQFVPGAIPADTTITYTASSSTKLNTTPNAVKSSTNPTSVTQPDGLTPIAVVSQLSD